MVMGVPMVSLSHRVETSEIEAGDHIYTWRTAFAYSHHGIYVGENKVVHFTPDQNLSSSDQFSSPRFSSSVSKVPAAAICLDTPDCGFRKHDTSGVTLSCLNCFLGNGSAYRFEYGVNRVAFIAKLRGGCTIAKSGPPQEVIHRAMHLLHNGFGNYDLFANNCEDFALYCKTGYIVRGKDALGGSGQASSAIGAPLSAVLSLSLRLVVSNPVAYCTSTAVVYTLNRYATDIGVRNDAIEVKVEDLPLLFRQSQVGDKDDATSSNGIDGNDTRPTKRRR